MEEYSGNATVLYSRVRSEKIPQNKNWRRVSFLSFLYRHFEKGMTTVEIR